VPVRPLPTRAESGRMPLLPMAVVAVWIFIDSIIGKIG
jgi:hypothetical protein